MDYGGERERESCGDFLSQSWNVVPSWEEGPIASAKSDHLHLVLH